MGVEGWASASKESIESEHLQFAGVGRLIKTYADMTDDELGKAHLLWSARMAESTGWAAFLFAAEQVELVAHEAARRSLRPVSARSDSSVVQRKVSSNSS
jgi:hypothetical protein